MNNNTAIKNIKETMTYGNSIKKKDPKEIFDVVYMTMLCGAPIGNTIHPTLAAIVCKQTVITIKSARLTFFNDKIENGTNIIRDHHLL